MRILIPLLFAQSLFAQHATYRHHGPALLPDPHATPGVVVISDKSKVCSVKWGKDARHVTAAMKAEVFSRYGVTADSGVCLAQKHRTGSGKTIVEHCEIDHLISRELGGADDVNNLWPQPYDPDPGAHAKDKAENWLHKQVCAGTISLAEAQQRIATDWYGVYLNIPRKK